MRAVISAIYPVLIQPFISTEEVRYYINGFYVHSDPNEGLRIVATDGHRLGVFHDREGLWEGPTNAGMIVKLSKPALDILKDKKSRTPLKKWLVVEGDIKANSATIIEGDDPLDNPRLVATFHDVLIDGTYPDYTKVVPSITKRDFKPASYNPKYLADFSRVLPKMGAQCIRLVSEDEAGPSLVLTSRDDFFGVLMPMRPGWEESNYYPDFWTRKPSQKGLKLVRGGKKKSAALEEVETKVAETNSQPDAA
jgi:DNA polymerase sliding clamp subunit (PCNA homolog)